jgi:hypothetical protein
LGEKSMTHNVRIIGKIADKLKLYIPTFQVSFIGEL